MIVFAMDAGLIGRVNTIVWLVRFIVQWIRRWRSFPSFFLLPVRWIVPFRWHHHLVDFVMTGVLTGRLLSRSTIALFQFLRTKKRCNTLEKLVSEIIDIHYRQGSLRHCGDMPFLTLHWVSHSLKIVLDLRSEILGILQLSIEWRDSLVFPD